MPAQSTSLLTLFLAASLVLTGCQTSAVPSAAAHEAALKSLRDADAAWEEAWSSRNLDKAMAGYADDATVLIPNMPAVTGRENIRASDKDFFADKNFAMHWDCVKAEVSQSEDLAYTQGTLTYSMTDPASGKAFSDKAKYLTVWKKQANGAWLAVEDTFNSDLPPSPAGK